MTARTLGREGGVHRFAAPGETPIVRPLIDDKTTPTQWEDQRAFIRARVEESLGQDPGLVTPNVSVLSEERRRGYVRIKISFATADDDRVLAYLLRPRSAPGTLLPAVLALHSTTPYGKDEAVGLRGDPQWAIGLELVRRGFVVLAPDEFVTGERRPNADPAYDTRFFYRRHGKWSAMGKMLNDHRQAISVLRSLDYVDGSKIGAIGHSLGGNSALWLLAFDERVAAAASSCGFSTFAWDPRPTRWSRLVKGELDDPFHFRFVYFPGIRRDIVRGVAPFEHHEVLALAAPRPCFIWTAKYDPIFPHWQAAVAALEDVGAVYALMGASDRFMSETGGRGHHFPRLRRLQAYRFLERWIGMSEGTHS